MTDLLNHRAIRFRALHDLLTGIAGRKSRPGIPNSAHLQRDIGLPEHMSPPAFDELRF